MINDREKRMQYNTTQCNTMQFSGRYVQYVYSAVPAEVSVGRVDLQQRLVLVAPVACPFAAAAAGIQFAFAFAFAFAIIRVSFRG